ncbi:hypothetical protein DMN91_002180 [Ooceraea biroi]|uniref:Uncharacterized protein n=1 Tax=Ooceraea biroi TaxID=2015173 RepID=A0A026WKI7_OOCBI|nr:uncharacterized protein LOC105278166 [Ooceraea biroi]EZA56555.1 hypothetical protein X777_03342 [Ooceraea biroi]RLU26017.1 hypothetical protein DMN91_002180 [Ooceraea biroi]
MAKFKMLFALFCILLIGHHIEAVVNKAASNVPLVKENDKSTKVNADDRISNTFTSLSDEYGPPSGLSFNGPAPVYGPPELVGNLGPTPIYPPPPPELPPPVYGSPVATYGPPLGIKPQYGPPKQTFSLASSSLHSKPSYGPPKLHYGPPKQLFAPPASIPPFRLPKPIAQYGPPLKLVGTTSQQYGLPPLASQHGPPKPGHGPPIPISFETYGPPPPKLPIQFNPLPNDEYGPPPRPLPAPQPQYGSPVGDLYGPPPPGPPPGVPAPPTPPDIKYDGWQPIAGLATPPNQNGALIDAKHNHIDSSSSSQLSHAALTVSTNPNAPSDSYGVPINNPEAQNLKTSVHESSASSESNGLPPPPLPQYEPLHNQGPGVISSGQSDHHQFAQQHLQQVTPNIESIVKTVGFELLPANEGLSGLSLSGGTSDVSSLSHIQNTVNVNSASLHSGLELTSDEGGSHAAALSNGGDSHVLQNIGNDLSLQQPVQQTPSADYGVPLTTATFGKHTEVLSGASLLAPPPLDSYGAPPLSSYSPTGPYPASQGGRGVHSSFGLFGNSFHKQNLQYHRFPGPFRPPPVPFSSLIPPRNRDPIKFKESIPTGLLSSINRYLPPPPAKQQLPNLHAPVSFHQTAGSSNVFSNAFASTSSLNGYDSNSPIAAPHVQYGTPLSFTDFNRPTPPLTYGAPNFGPATSFVSMSSEVGSNLYSGIGNTLTTYGTPVVNAPLSDNGGYDCNLNSLQPLLPANEEQPLSGSLPSSGELHSTGELHLSGGLSSGGEALSSEKLSLAGELPAHESAHSSGKLQIGFESAGNVDNHGSGFTNSLPTGSAQVEFTEGNHQNSIFTANSLPLVKPRVNFLEGPPLNTLDLQHSEQQKTNLKDSYGNPVGITYDPASEASNSGAIHAPAADAPGESSAQLSSQFHDAYSAATSDIGHGSGLTAEALTASLTAQGYGQEKNFGANEVDASQFLNSNEGSEALSVAQRLTAENADGFEIQGSKGTYRLQIQPADGGLGTENSDGSIRHDQLLSNGLLQDILAAIEQPENGAVQLHGLPQAQKFEQAFGSDLRPQGTAITNGHFITVGNQAQNDGLYDQVQQASDRREDGKYVKNPSVALFYNTRYGKPRKEIRSLTKSEMQAIPENEQSDCDSL